MRRTTKGGDIAAFTYLKDQEGYIYYASGDNNLGADVIRSVLVYAPVPDGRATRYQLSSGTGYIKSVSHGYRSELPRMREELSPEGYSTIRGMLKKDSDSGDEFLALPVSRIAEVYSPKASLTELLAGDVDGYSQTAIAKLNEAVEAFISQSIELGRLGLYGGLQCHLTRVGNKEIDDIDMLVDGLDAYEGLVNLATGNVVRPETFPSFVAKNAIKRAVAIRRGQLSQFRLRGHPDTVVDARLLRTDQDRVDRPIVIPARGTRRSIALEGAEVISATESLSVPTRYDVRDRSGGNWSVVTNHYHHLGAAHTGDQVVVHGDTVDDGVIVLADPDRHHIYNPSI